MSDFQTFIANSLAEIDNQNTRTDAYVRRAAVRALKEVSSIRCLLNEDTFSFTTTIGQQEYTEGYASFALDIAKILVVFYANANGSARQIVERVPLEEVRLSGSWSTGCNPQRYCWHSNSLILGPVPSAAVAITIDYQRDATRDTGTGNPITIASTTATNPWFDRGEHVLRALVLRDYHMSISGDTVKAGAMGALGGEGISTLRQDYKALSTTSAQAPSYLQDGWGEYRFPW